jgi:hypoxia up-regulated 1
VALNYAMLRKFDQTQHHIFYDMGAGSTVASLVTFSNVIQKRAGSNFSVPQLQVKAVGSDPTLGGKAIDLRIQQILLDHFVTKTTKGKVTKEKVLKSSKAMAKLLREANRVKQILSANTETFASVEGLYDDYDFRMKLTRAELEEVCKDLFDRVKGPIQSVLEETKLTIADIDSVVLVGGGVRVPMIQTVLKDFVGR